MSSSDAARAQCPWQAAAALTSLWLPKKGCVGRGI